MFPVQPGGKRPLIERNLEVATTDPEQIREWWKKYPAANIGVVADDGVLDIDITKGGIESARKLFGQYGKPQTLVVRTQSGGFHYYFRGPLPTTAGRLGPGIDTRGEGKGYVLAPGSVVNGRPYRIFVDAPIAPVPDWLRAALAGNAGKPAAVLPDVILEGEREATLVSLAGSMRARGASRDAIYAAISAENESRCSPPLPDEDLQRIAGSVAKYQPEPTATDEFEAVPGAEPPAATGNPRLAALRELNETYAVVQIGADVVIMQEREDEDPTFLSAAAFKLLLQHKVVPHEADMRKTEKLANAWLDWPERRQFKSVEFRPGETLPADRYNLWRGWPISPSEEGSCDLFLDHLRNVVCLGEDEHFRWLLNWMAHLFQYPQEKPLTVLALAGDPGAGKSIVGDILGVLLGPYRVVAEKQEHVVGNFNAHLERCLLLQSEEAFWGGDKRVEGALKHLVTGKTLSIERKGVDRVERPNFTRMLVTSNDARVWPTALNDRRLAIFEVANTRRGDMAYFDAMFDQLENGGYQRLLHELLTYQVDRSLVRTPPVTRALEAQADESLSPEDSWLRELLEMGQVDGELQSDGSVHVLSSTLYESYASSAGQQHRFLKNRQAFGRYVEKHLGGTNAGRKMVGGKRSNVVAIPPLPVCRKMYVERGRAARAFAESDENWITTNEFLHP